MDAVGGGDMNLGELADLTVANDNDLSMDVNIVFVSKNLHNAKLLFRLQPCAENI